jgi:hypothetical protein
MPELRRAAPRIVTRRNACQIVSAGWVDTIKSLASKSQKRK